MNSGDIVPPPTTAKILSAEERNDLRKKVLSGQDLTLEEARSVYETIRLGGAAAMINGETTRKKGGKRKKGMSDEELSSDLDKALADI